MYSVSFVGVLVLVITIKKEYNGMTVLHILKQVLGLSRGMIKHLKFLDDGILLNGDRVTVRKTVREGDILTLNTDEAEESGIEAVDLDLEVIYEDDDIVVPDKPPFMPTHPSHDHYRDTVANALAFRYRDSSVPYVFRPVNRLDRNTSGVVLIAKNRVSAASLSESLQKGLITKKYLAILDGVPAEKSEKIETYIRRRQESIIYREVCEKMSDADYALTEYEVMEVSGDRALVCASPITGRTHQLRLHFAHIGCPIIGDDLYGLESGMIGRQALHAYSLDFPCPRSGEKIHVRAPLPEDLKEALKKLGFKYEQ